MRLHVADHPLVAHKLTYLRDERVVGDVQAHGAQPTG